MNRTQNYGAALLRISLGIVFIVHSVYLKGVVFTLAGSAAYFDSIGLPGFLAYVVFVVEAVGGVALIAGIRVREFATALAVISAGATWAHFGSGWLFTNEGGGWEYPAFLAVVSAAQALLGAGALTIRASARNAGRGGLVPGR